MMETVDHPCDKPEQSSSFVSHLCSKGHTVPPSLGQSDQYRCSQCDLVFPRPLALKKHFKTSHKEQELRGPFTCQETNCQFSSSDRQDYQVHLGSAHGLDLICCTYSSCRGSFLTQDDMERHRRSHMPFGCFHCQFVSENVKDMKVHMFKHNSLRNSCHDAESMGKQRKEVEESDNLSAWNAAALPSKEYLAEGSENIYRTHTCPKCRRCFKMRSHLQEHLRLHFPDPSLQCPTCKSFFTSKSKLRLHQLREAGEKTHRCQLCEYSAVERNAIRRHVASMHPDRTEDGVNSQSFRCPTCSQSFHQSRTLKAHMKTHTIRSHSTPLVCFHEGCSFQSSVRKDLIKHASEAHGIKAVSCRHHACGAAFPSQAEMEAHYQTHLPYHCSDCDFSCSNKSVFLHHQRLGHPGEERLRCDFCPFVTFNPVEFEQHVGHLHANEKIHRCSQCSYLTAHKRGLKRHMLMHGGEKPHKCSLCDFRCRDESYLSKHMLVHTDHKNFMCSDCGYVTRWKHYLTVHMRKHAGDLRYWCDQCSYRCHRMDQLKSHKLRHQAKSLMCEICAYTCKRKYELHNHMLAKHSGEAKTPAAFRCKYCTYTTFYRQALQNHENCKHTKLREFRCALCIYSSFSNISLFLHKRKVHGYVPGDKAWLENYAAKEREKNSVEFMQDFYVKPSADSEQLKEPSHGSETPAAQSTEHGSTRETAVDSVLDVVSQEVVNEAASDRSVSSPEEFCTLVLTTLPTEEPTKPAQNQTTNRQRLRLLNRPDSPQETPDSPAPANSLEEGNTDTQDGPCEQTRVDESQTNTSEPGQSGEDQTPQGKNTSQPSTPEIRLKALKQHDKDQAEAMLLEGRVQMLAVPLENVYHCDKCSYVTYKETTFKNHTTLCRGRMTGYRCQACGVQLKHKSGLEYHLKTKCPAHLHQARTSGGFSNTHPGSKNTAGQEESERMEQGTSSDAEPVEKRSRIKIQTVSLQRKGLYVKTEGKFRCRRCSFSSVQLRAVKQHVLTCRQEDQMVSNLDPKGGKGRIKKFGETLVEVSNKQPMFHCPNCEFKCRRKRALDNHKKEGCTRSEEVQGSKSSPSLSRHVSQKHRAARAHRCRFCPFSTARRYRLQEHESQHTRIGRHTCHLCSKTFGAVAKLRQHTMRIHEKQPTHTCSLCDFRGYSPDDVRRHKRRCHTGELRHICTHCDAQFNSEIALRNHCKRAHQLQACFTCRTCNYTCNSDVALKNHQQNKHLDVKCATCRESFETRESLEVHQRSHLAHRCQLCTFAARTRELLAEHLQSEHEEGSSEDKPLRCSACQFTCRHQLVLEQHLRSHGAKRLYRCTDCEYTTGNKQKMTWHVRIHTGEKPYGCEACSYTCSDPSRLKLHMRVHGEEKKYLCPECGYKCKWATQLKYHMTKHTGEKPYACDECDYRTNRADALRVHRDTQHCDARPYVCEKCGKTFKTSFVLKTHQRKHSKDRSYTCGLCQKSFRWPAGLRHHYLSHTKQQPFCCRHCSYRAKQKFQVVKHLQRHHPEVPLEQGVCRDPEGGILTLKEALQGTLAKAATQEPASSIQRGS